jgi:plastocyanin
MTKLHGTLAALGVIALVVAGCGSSSTTGYGSSSTAATSTGAAPAASGSTITISGMSFGDPITVSPGAQIDIVNHDTVEHSVTSQPKGKFNTDVDGGQQKSFTAPTEPGEYPFICVYHSNMKGTLIVK